MASIDKAITDTVKVAAAAASLRASIITGAMGARFDASKAEILVLARCDRWTIQCVSDECDTKASYELEESQEVREAIDEIRARASVSVDRGELESMVGIEGYTAYILIAAGDGGIAVTFE